MEKNSSKKIFHEDRSSTIESSFNHEKNTKISEDVFKI